MRLAATGTALALILAAAASAGAQESPGRARMVKLMDRVISNPKDELAREKLDAEAKRAVAAERRFSEKERARLLEEAAKAKEKRDSMNAAKALRLAAWKKDFNRACSLASDPDTVRHAVEAYEELLLEFPVYSDTRKLLAASETRVMGIFYRTIKDSYPYLAQGRETADARMLASLVFSRASERQAEYGGSLTSGMAEAQLKKAERLNSLEALLKRQHSNFIEAISLYGRKHWPESIKYFDEILDFDSENEEALYYRELAAAKAAAERKKR